MLDAKGLTEEEYIRKYKLKNYPKPALTADIVVVAHEDDLAHEDDSAKPGRSYLLMIKRGGHPYIGCWALPGGFAEESEYIEESAARELVEETGIEDLALKPVGLFTKPGRDPRGWTVSQVYRADVKLADCRPIAGDDAADTAWFEIRRDGDESCGTIQLISDNTDIQFRYSFDGDKVHTEMLSTDAPAFDHSEIIAKALAK